jgi:hypothetical protein
MYKCEKIKLPDKKINIICIIIVIYRLINFNDEKYL